MPDLVKPPPLESHFVDQIVFTDEDKREAEQVAADIDKRLATIKHHESELGSNYISIGTLLLQVRNRRFWVLWRYVNFDAYLAAIGLKGDKGRTQLYGYMGVVEKLLPMVGEAALVRMGISKAQELKRLVAQTGSLPAGIAEKAQDSAVTREQLRVSIGEETNTRPESERGTYRDLGGFYATAEEWKTFQDAFDIAARTDPVIPEGLPAWVRFKTILERLCQEYIGEYAGRVEEGVA